MQSSVFSVSFYRQSAPSPLYICSVNPIKSLLTHQGCVRVRVRTDAVPVSVQSGSQLPRVHVYKCVCWRERRRAREKERERKKKWPWVFVHSYWCFGGVHVVTVDITLTSSQSSLLSAWAFGHQCQAVLRTLVCSKCVCFVLGFFSCISILRQTLSCRVYSPPTD